MKCWVSALNAQGSRVIIVVVHVGAVKTYVAAVQALRKKETQDEFQFTTKIGGKTSLGPSYFLFVKFHSQLRVWCPIMLNFSLPPKLVEKLVWVPVISFCKISFPIMCLMPYYAEAGRFHTLITWLLWITLIHPKLLVCWCVFTLALEEVVVKWTTTVVKEITGSAF